MKRIALFDLSGIFRSAWHSTEHEEIGAAFNRTVSTITTSAAGYDAVAVCCDRPPYKRKEILKTYKENRERAPEAMHEQLRAVEKRLDDDGLHVIGAAGYEADDIMATIAEWAAANGHHATVYSADKDMLQLVGASVAVVSTATRQKYASIDDVKAKMGVGPSLIPDLLALMGDAADNIPGVKGVGIKTAAQWLAEIGPLEYLLQHNEKIPERFREAVRLNADAISVSWRLAQLMTDAPINPESIMEQKQRKEAEAVAQVAIPEDETPTPVVEAQGMTAAENPKALALRQPDSAVPWEKALEPKSSAQAWGIANTLYKSRLFGDFPNPEAILAIVMTGRSMGMDTVASLRGFHLIKGKPCPSAALLVGLVKRHPQCEWFRLVESTGESATWQTKRRDEPEATTMTFTMKDAAAAQLSGNDQWKKRPATMLRWRAATELARAVYPDITAGLYSAEEMQDEAA